jgi:hypothetical protein
MATGGGRLVNGPSGTGARLAASVVELRTGSGTRGRREAAADARLVAASARAGRTDDGTRGRRVTPAVSAAVAVDTGGRRRMAVVSAAAVDMGGLRRIVVVSVRPVDMDGLRRIVVVSVRAVDMGGALAMARNTGGGRPGIAALRSDASGVDGAMTGGGVALRGRGLKGLVTAGTSGRGVASSLGRGARVRRLSLRMMSTPGSSLQRCGRSCGR